MTLNIRWYKGRDCGPRSEQGIAAKAAPVVNEGPAGAVRQGRTGVRHRTAQKVSTFWAVGIRPNFLISALCWTRYRIANMKPTIRLLEIGSVFSIILLTACDQAIDDRYAGLVVVPVQEVPVTQSQGVAGIKSTDHLPRVRPELIPERERTPKEAQLAALDAETTLSLLREDTLAAQARADLAEQNRRESAEALIAARWKEQFAATIPQQSSPETLGLTNPQVVTQAPIEPFDPFAKNPDNLVIAASYLPRPRPADFPQSVQQVEAFLADRAQREKAKAQQQEYEQLLFEREELVRQAEADRLAAQRQEAERRAAVADMEAVETARQAAAKVLRQVEAETVAAEATREAERLANIGSTILPVSQSSNQNIEAPRSVTIPLIYDASSPLTTLDELKATLNQDDYDLTAIMAGNPVPAIILQRLPANFSDLRLSNPNMQKDLFIKSVLPLCLVANERLEVDRVYILSDDEVEDRLQSVKDAAVRGLGFKYAAASRAELRTKIDAIPVSLCLAQAIVASNWGQNQSSINQNALFGSWTWDRDDEGVRRSRPTTLEDRNQNQIAFSSLQASVDAFSLYLNRDDRFAAFRAERARATQQGRRLSGMVAAEFMSELNPENPGTISNLLRVISENRLDQYDLSRLQGLRRAVAVF